MRKILLNNVKVIGLLSSNLSGTLYGTVFGVNGVVISKKDRLLKKQRRKRSV